MDRNYRSFKFGKFLSLVLGLVFVPVFAAFTTHSVDAAINNTINFQSKIVDKTTGLNISNGTPACVTSGADTCDFQIRIWNDATGTTTTSGTGNLMFTQTFQDVEIGDTNGIFNLIINSCGSAKSGTSHWGTSVGNCTVVDDSDSDADAGVNFDRSDLWIEVSFAPSNTSGSLGSFTEVFSRTNLKSVPSAFVAQTLSGIGADGFVQLAPSAAQVSTSTNSLINLETTANTSNPLLKLNENGSGTPSLLDLQVAGSSVFSVGNSGNLAAGSASLSNTSTFNISKTYSSGSTANGLVLGTTTNSNTLFNSISGISNTVSLTSNTTYHLQPIITGLSNKISNSTNIGNSGQIIGIYNHIDFSGSRTYDLNNITGENIYINTGTGSGTVGRIVGLDISISKWAESVTDLKGINVSTFSGPPTTATNVYGLYVDNQTIGTNDYGIYVEGADTYAIWTDDGVNRFDGNILAGTITNSAYLNIAAATASQASILIESSAGTDPSSPTSGNLWWNGTNLNFRTGSSTVDLLSNAAGSFVNFTPAATQTTTSTNSLINLTSTATSATNTLVLVNENGTGTPSLMDLQVAGSSRFLVANSGNITTVGSLTSVGVNSGTGLIQGTGGLTITGAAVSLNAGSNFVVNIGTGTSSGTITLGGTATQTINLGNGSGDKTVNLGSSNTTSTTTILSGSGGLNLNVSNNQITNINTGTSTSAVNIGGAGGNVVINANNWGVNSSGQAGLGTSATSSSFLTLAAATTSASSLRLTSSGGTNVSSPNSGDLWWNGTNLNFRTGSSTIDLLAGAAPCSGPGCEILDNSRQLQLSTQGSGGGISIGGDTALYRETGAVLSTLNDFYIGGRLGLGAGISTEDKFYVVSNVTANNSGTTYSNARLGLTVNPDSAATINTYYKGIRNDITISGSNYYNNVTGSDVYITNNSSNTTFGNYIFGDRVTIDSSNGTTSSLRAYTAMINQSGAASTTQAYGLITQVNTSSSGTLFEAAGIVVGNNATSGSGTITTNYGIKIDMQNVASSSDYGLYIAGSDDYALYSGTGMNYFGGNVNIGTFIDSAFLTIGAATSSKPAISLVSSSGTNPSSPNSGDLWWNGTNLNFRTGSSTIDLLAGGSCSTCVSLAPAPTQSSTSINSLINLTSTATGATNPLILVNENGTGTPNLLDLQVAGTSRFTVNNSGGLAIGDGTAINSFLDVRNTYTNTSGFISMQYNQMTLNPASASTTTLISSWNQALTGSANANTINRIVGIYNQAIHQGTNTLSNATGVLGEVKVDSTGSITTANGAELNAQLTGGGNIDTLRNLYVNNATVSSGAITDNYGLYVVNQTAGTNDYGIYVAGADTYAIWSDSGVNRFDGNVLAGTTTNTAFLNIAGATSAQASLRLLSSSGTAPSSPNSGDLWWDGGSLVFYSGSSYYDLLNPSFSCPSCLTLAPSGTQSTSSTNSLINVATTGNTSNPLVNITENGAGTPDLLRLNVGVTNRAKITNNGQLEIVGNTNATNLLNIGGTYSTVSGGNSVFSLSANQTVASSGSMDVLNLFTSFSGSGTLAGMNGAVIRPQSTGSGTVTNVSGIAIWPKANTGSFGNLYGLNIYDAEVGGGGSISNYYGLYVTNLTTGTNSYGLYVAGAKTNAIYANTGTSSTIGLRIQGASGQSANYIDIIDNSSSPVFNVTSAGNVNANTFIASGVFTANAAVNTRIQASGAGAGSTGTGSIYFLGSDGSTKGRVDTVNTDQLKTEGDGADGAITISTSIFWDSAILATGRTTYADGIAYRVNPPDIGDTAVTRYRSADNLSNGIVAGDEVLVINLQGNLIGTGTTAVFDNASVGNYEFRTVASISASTITFTEPLERRYSGLNQNQQRVIVQRVPNYTNVTLNSGGNMLTTAYDGLGTVPSGSAGYRTGIIAFRANGTVTVNTGGAITLSAVGYRGGAAGAAGVNGGFNGESYDNTGDNTTGRGGSGSSLGETWGGGRSSNGAVADPANGIPRGGGGGGGSNGSASDGDDGSGAGGGGGYGGGGGGGGGGSNASVKNGGAGGAGGSTGVPAGGGAGAQNASAAGVDGGNAGSAGSNATGTGGSAGDGKISGSGGGGAKIATAGGAGGGGGGLYGFPDLSAIFLGSGGGGGAGGFNTHTAGQPGGAGGGILYIGADTINVTGGGVISAPGGNATNGTAPASGGGGGSGGSIYLDVFNLTYPTNQISAAGGSTGTIAARRGAGGGGGVGRIFIKYRNSLSGTTNIPTPTVAQVTQNYGTLHIGSVNTTEADLAEYYVTGDREIEAGDVVSISPYRLITDNEEEITSQGVLRKTVAAYDSKLVGVISTAPGVILGSIDGQTGNTDQRALALSGRVPVKIDPDSEPISIGDYLTSSTKAGYAKKATQPGYVLGKALEYWNKDLNKPKIMTFVGLGYYNGGNSSTEEALRLASSRGLSVSNAYNPSVNIKIVQNATDGQVLGTITESSITLEAGQVDESVSVEALEKSMSLALGRSEMSDYFLNNDSSITVGDVVKFDLNNNLIKAGGISNRGDTEVLGVTSTQPNTLLSAILETSNNSSVTLGGKVVLKVTDLNGPIKKGDYLAASDIPGYAMKADNANGIILGRALEDFPLSVSPDSSLVKRELSRNKTEMINLLNNLIADGFIKAEDKQKYEDSINQFTSSFKISNVDGKNAGRILAFVNIGFITEGVMLPKNANLADNSLPGTTEEVSEDLSNLLSKIQNTKLTLSNVLTVKNVIEAQTYQNITGLDLAFKISSQNNSFKVVNVNEESIFQVDQNGKISIKSGANSSIGKAVLQPGTIELFVENTSITDNSQIYLTPDQFVFSRVKSKNPGQGFWIELENGFTDKTVNVDYLIIN